AALDVYEQEPHVTPALLTMENVVLLPHLGSATQATRVALGMRALDNLAAFFAGSAPRDRVVSATTLSSPPPTPPPTTPTLWRPSCSTRSSMCVAPIRRTPR